MLNRFFLIVAGTLFCVGVWAQNLKPIAPDYVGATSLEKFKGEHSGCVNGNGNHENYSEGLGQAGIATQMEYIYDRYFIDPDDGDDEYKMANHASWLYNFVRFGKPEDIDFSTTDDRFCTQQIWHIHIDEITKENAQLTFNFMLDIESNSSMNNSSKFDRFFIGVTQEDLDNPNPEHFTESEAIAYTYFKESTRSLVRNVKGQSQGDPHILGGSDHVNAVVNAENTNDIEELQVGPGNNSNVFTKKWMNFSVNLWRFHGQSVNIKIVVSDQKGLRTKAFMTGNLGRVASWKRGTDPVTECWGYLSRIIDTREQCKVGSRLNGLSSFDPEKCYIRLKTPSAVEPDFEYTVEHLGNGEHKVDYFYNGLSEKINLEVVAFDEVNEIHFYSSNESSKADCSVGSYDCAIWKLKREKTYHFSGWVYNESDGKAGVQFVVWDDGGNSTETTHWSEKEGSWEKLDFDFKIEGAGGDPNRMEMLLLNDGDGDVYFDDLRVVPQDGSCVTYVYNEHTGKLEAEFDENNYPTYHQYNDEGKLARIKKKTEKGILTIKEFGTEMQKGR